MGEWRWIIARFVSSVGWDWGSWIVWGCCASATVLRESDSWSLYTYNQSKPPQPTKPSHFKKSKHLPLALPKHSPKTPTNPSFNTSSPNPMAINLHMNRRLIPMSLINTLTLTVGSASKVPLLVVVIKLLENRMVGVDWIAVCSCVRQGRAIQNNQDEGREFLGKPHDFDTTELPIPNIEMRSDRKHIVSEILAFCSVERNISFLRVLRTETMGHAELSWHAATFQTSDGRNKASTGECSLILQHSWLG